MKNMQSKNPNQNIKFDRNRHRPENKDDLDSREGQEQLYKGDDVTHNRKERKNVKRNTKKKRL
jgi:hypothetical protein